MSSSRESVLGRIRQATGGSDPRSQNRDLRHPGDEYGAIEKNYVRAGRLSAEERLALMVDRLREYDAEVVETTPAGLTQAIAAALAASGRHRFVVPPGLPREWMAAGFEWKIDNDLPASEIETCEGVVTASTCGVADSGTIVLHHTAAEGRRAISLLPDWHLCVLRASDVVETLPEYFAGCAEPPQLATYISGPSATADIEMTRIKGVHGPRFLNVVLVRNPE